MHLKLFCRKGSLLRCELHLAKNADQQVGTESSFLVELQRRPVDLYNTLLPSG